MTSVFILFCGSTASLAGDELARSIENSLRSSQCEQLAIAPSDLNELKRHYSEWNHSAAWISDGQINGQAKVLLAELKRSSAHGLKPDFYKHALLVELSETSSIDKLTCFEILLSKAFVLYANDIANGHVRKTTSPANTLVEPIVYGAAELLEKTGSEAQLAEFLKSLLTTDDRYIRLITKMAEFLRIQELNAWPKLNANGFSDDSEVDMEKIRNLLLYTGDLRGKDFPKATPGSDVMSEAIVSFQERHGLPVTRKVDRSTFEEMALPLSQRINMIRVNLERRRWQNRDLGPDNAYVNINDNSIRFVRNFKKSGTAKISKVDGLGKLPTFYGEIKAFRVGQNGEAILEVVSETQDLEVELVLRGKFEDSLTNLFKEAADIPAGLTNGKRVDLKNPLSLYVTYLTVWANKDGSIHFRSDKFNRDREIARLLQISDS